MKRVGVRVDVSDVMTLYASANREQDALLHGIVVFKNLELASVRRTNRQLSLL